MNPAFRFYPLPAASPGWVLWFTLLTVELKQGKFAIPHAIYLTEWMPGTKMKSPLRSWMPVSKDGLIMFATQIPGGCRHIYLISLPGVDDRRLDATEKKSTAATAAVQRSKIQCSVLQWPAFRWGTHNINENRYRRYGRRESCRCDTTRAHCPEGGPETAAHHAPERTGRFQVFGLFIAIQAPFPDITTQV